MGKGIEIILRESLEEMASFCGNAHMEKVIEIKSLEGMGKCFEKRITIVMHKMFSNKSNNY